MKFQIAAVLTAGKARADQEVMSCHFCKGLEMSCREILFRPASPPPFLLCKQNVSSSHTTATESTRDPFHLFASTRTCTAEDNGLQTGWISIPLRQQVIQAEAEIVDPPSTHRQSSSLSDLYSYGLHVSEYYTSPCAFLRCVHTQSCVTGVAAADAAWRVQSHTTRVTGLHMREFAMRSSPCGGDWHVVRDSKW